MGFKKTDYTMEAYRAKLVNIKKTLETYLTLNKDATHNVLEKTYAQTILGGVNNCIEVLKDVEKNRRLEMTSNKELINDWIVSLYGQGNDSFDLPTDEEEDLDIKDTIDTMLENSPNLRYMGRNILKEFTEVRNCVKERFKYYNALAEAAPDKRMKVSEVEAEKWEAMEAYAKENKVDQYTYASTEMREEKKADAPAEDTPENIRKNFEMLSKGMAKTNEGFTKQSNQFDHFRTCCTKLQEELAKYKYDGKGNFAAEQTINYERLAKLVAAVEIGRQEYAVHCLKHQHTDATRSQRVYYADMVMDNIHELKKDAGIEQAYNSMGAKDKQNSMKEVVEEPQKKPQKEIKDIHIELLDSLF